MRCYCFRLCLALCVLLAFGLAPDLVLGADAGALPELKRNEIEISTRLVLFKDLAARHQKRSEEAQAAGQADRAQWESALARDFTEQAGKAAAMLETTTRDRLAAEEKGEKSKDSPPPDSEENAYLGKIDGLLLTVSQDLVAALEAGKNLASQLQTNSGPEQMAVVSAQLSENRFQLRMLEKERASLELEKLRFRALKAR